MERWIESQVARHLPALKALAKAAADPEASPGVRALAAMLVDAGGQLPRRSIAAQLAALTNAECVGVVHYADTGVQELLSHVIHELRDNLILFFVVLWLLKEFTANAIALNVGGLQMLGKLSCKVCFARAGKAVEQN